MSGLNAVFTEMGDSNKVLVRIQGEWQWKDKDEIPYYGRVDGCLNPFQALIQGKQTNCFLESGIEKDHPMIAPDIDTNVFIINTHTIETLPIDEK